MMDSSNTTAENSVHMTALDQNPIVSLADEPLQLNDSSNTATVTSNMSPVVEVVATKDGLNAATVNPGVDTIDGSSAIATISSIATALDQNTILSPEVAIMDSSAVVTVDDSITTAANSVNITSLDQNTSDNPAEAMIGLNTTAVSSGIAVMDGLNTTAISLQSRTKMKRLYHDHVYEYIEQYFKR